MTWPLAFFIAFFFAFSPTFGQETMRPAKAPQQHWTFTGVSGYFDDSNVQRGYLIYKKNCSSCHTLSELHFSDFSQMGLSAEHVQQLANTWQVATHIDGTGQVHFRKPLPSDAIPSPYLNQEIARAANDGVVPPDLSRLLKIYPGGADRLYAFLLSFPEQTQSHAPWHNPYTIGHLTAMPPPFLHATLQHCQENQHGLDEACQKARDVTTFLAWASWPMHDARHRLGVEVCFYLAFLIILVALLKRRLWSHANK